MAEARSISELRSRVKERGVRLHSDEDGYHFSLSVTIPPKEVALHIVRGRLRRFGNFVVNGMYPMSHLFALVFSVGLVFVVLLSDEHAWVRRHGERRGANVRRSDVYWADAGWCKRALRGHAACVR